MAVDVETIERGAGSPGVPAEADICKGKIVLSEVDGALAFLHTGNDVESTELDEKELVRKIDFVIMPLLFGVYVLQFVDKSLSKSGAHRLP